MSVVKKHERLAADASLIAARVWVALLGLLIPAAACLADVLIDNMEGPRTNRALSGGYWFLFVDAKSKELGNTEILYPDGYGYNFRFADQGYQSDHCARMKARLGAGYDYPFIGMGVNLDGYKRMYPFCAVSSIEFMARGKGVFKLKLRDAWGYKQSPRKEYSHEFAVSPEWRRYRLRPRDFTVDYDSPARRAGKTWRDVCDSVSTLIFVTSSYAARDVGTVVDLQIDNIVIRGLDEIGLARDNAPKAEPLVDGTEFPIDIGDDAPETESRRAE